MDPTTVLPTPVKCFVFSLCPITIIASHIIPNVYTLSPGVDFLLFITPLVNCYLVPGTFIPVFMHSDAFVAVHFIQGWFTPPSILLLKELFKGVDKNTPSLKNVIPPALLLVLFFIIDWFYFIALSNLHHWRSLGTFGKINVKFWKAVLSVHEAYYKMVLRCMNFLCCGGIRRGVRNLELQRRHWDGESSHGDGGELPWEWHDLPTYPESIVRPDPHDKHLNIV